MVFDWLRGTPRPSKEQEFHSTDIRETRELRNRVALLVRDYDPDDFFALIPKSLDVAHEFAQAKQGSFAVDLFKLGFELAALDGFMDPLRDCNDTAIEQMELRERVRYRAQLQRTLRIFSNFEETSQVWANTFAQSCAALLTHVPKESEGDQYFPVFAIDVIKDIRAAIQQGVLFRFIDEDVRRYHIFGDLAQQLMENIKAAAAMVPEDPKFAGYSAHQLVQTFLAKTPYLDFFLNAKVIVTLDQASRMSHHHIVAGTGHGKTQALQYMIARDLDAVEQGEASVIVLDSQRQMIDTLKRLKLFAPGQPLHGKLVVIDPTDTEHPISLPLFQQPAGADEAEAERLHNASVSLLSYVFSGLLGAQLTSYQHTMMEYAFRLCMKIPDATIFTLREVLKDARPFAEHIQRLDPLARDFFETEYAGNRYRGAREEVQSKLFSVFNNLSLTRMFSNPVPTFDMFAEMAVGKVILIDTAKDHLQGASSLFGRFFIAMVQQAAQRRLNRKKLPTYLYVDEAHEYFDTRVSEMLEQARKSNIGMVLAHQYLGQLKDIEQSVMANTAIKFAGGPTHDDATKLARIMGTTPEYIRMQPLLTFVGHVKGGVTAALAIPAGHMEEMEQMSDREWRQVQAEMRARYSFQPQPIAPAVAPAPAPTGADDTAPTDW